MSETEKKKNKQWSLPKLVLAAVILLAAVTALTLAILWQINTFSLKLTMKGPREVIIEYGENYVESGAQAVFQGSIFMKEPSDVAISTEGTVDISTVGTYHITYSASRTVECVLGDVEVHDSARRTVQVVDTMAPVITLVADPDTYTIPGQVYQEEGFAASDNYDGDITELVVRTETEEAVTYQVADSSGNMTEISRAIVYHDPIAPVITLSGKSSLSVELGSTYAEPGYTATDNCDGDITDLVTVTGTVNTKKAGTYKLEYTVQDNYENTASVTRTVKVYEPEPETEPPTKATESTKPTESSKATESTKSPTEASTEAPTETLPKNPVGGVIYLTFDDGPSSYTPRLLDILAKYRVKATFFVVNTGYISTISRIAAEGHSLAMHSATHNFKQIYASEEAYFADLTQMQSIIQQHTGVTSMLLRFPGGSSNTVSRFNEGIMTRLTAMVEEQGYTYFDWNVDSDDAGSARTASKVFHNVINACAQRKSSVVLMHDIKSYTVDAIEDIIIWGLENGYTFRALTADSPSCHHSVNN